MQDLKIASMVSASTTTLGFSLIFEWIPNDIGKLATLIGVCLSIVLMYVHLKKVRIESKKLEIQIKKEELERKLLEKKLNSKD